MSAQPDTSANETPAVLKARPRVLFIQTQGENAGAQEITRLVGAGLSARGYDVHNLFFYRKSALFNEPPKTLYCAPERPGRPIAFMRFLYTLGQRIRKVRPDVILTFQHYGNTVGGAVARLVSSAPIVANQVSSNLTMNRLVRAADYVMGNLAIFKCITVNSPGMLREFSRYPLIYRSRLQYIAHGFEQKNSEISKAGARRNFALPSDVTVLGTVARLHPRKRIDAAIRVLKDQPGWHLAVAGQGADQQRLTMLAEQLQVTDRVHFVGEIGPERIGEFLASLDVFVFPSEAETFGLAAVEAASAGIPTVVTDIPVLREVLCHEGRPAVLFVDPLDTAKLSAAISRLLADEVLRERLRHNAEGLKLRYSIDAMVDQYARTIDRLGISS